LGYPGINQWFRMHYDGGLIIDNFKKQDNDTLDFIYRKFYPAVRNLVVLNSGSEDDARDIFQESIVVIYRKLTYDDLTLSCSFKTYLYAIAKRLWLKELEKRRLSRERLSAWEVWEDEGIEEPIIEEKDARYRLYQDHFMSLSEKCQRLLRLFYQKVPLREIAELMGFSSEKYAKKRKYQCKENLIKRIKEDPRFANL